VTPPTSEKPPAYPVDRDHQLNAPKGNAAGGLKLRSGYALPAFQTSGILILIDASLSASLSRRSGIYDNMKTAVETIFVGKERLYNRRFMQMCSHYLVAPVACTPASGWEKGQVENQVGLVRERFFTPRLRFKTLDELNAWLLNKCIAYAKAHRHPELSEQTVCEVFEADGLKLVPYAGRSDGFHAMPASVSNNNRYSVTASAVGRPVEVHAYADRMVIRQDGRIVAKASALIRPRRDDL
jgi:hypothetical protein